MGKNNNPPKSKAQPEEKKPKAKAESQQSKLQSLVQQNPDFKFIENGKIKCIITKHEFLPTLANFQKYLASKSYKKGVESKFDISEYEQYLITHKDNPNFLFCRLTGLRIPKKKTAIERHLSSRKFQYRLKSLLEEGEEGSNQAEEAIQEDVLGEDEEQEEEEAEVEEEGEN